MNQTGHEKTCHGADSGNRTLIRCLQDSRFTVKLSQRIRETGEVNQSHNNTQCRFASLHEVKRLAGDMSTALIHRTSKARALLLR